MRQCSETNTSRNAKMPNRSGVQSLYGGEFRHTVEATPEHSETHTSRNVQRPKYSGILAMRDGEFLYTVEGCTCGGALSERGQQCDDQGRPLLYGRDVLRGLANVHTCGLKASLCALSFT